MGMLAGGKLLEPARFPWGSARLFCGISTFVGLMPSLDNGPLLVHGGPQPSLRALRVRL